MQDDPQVSVQRTDANLGHPLWPARASGQYFFRNCSYIAKLPVSRRQLRLALSRQLFQNLPKQASTDLKCGLLVSRKGPAGKKDSRDGGLLD